jgi:hypothetical protein
MAFTLPPSGEAGDDRYQPLAEINVTPMVDVMLVLLIIFMVTAPLLQVGVPVDLPKTSAQQVGGKDEPLVVSVNSKGEVFLGETPYAEGKGDIAKTKAITSPCEPPRNCPIHRMRPVSSANKTVVFSMLDISATSCALDAAVDTFI